MSALMSAALAIARKSAPAHPSVRSATAASVSRLGRGVHARVCTAKIFARASASGSPKKSSRSNRPGRRSAGSTASGRLVDATTTTEPRPDKPSMSASSVATTEE